MYAYAHIVTEKIVGRFLWQHELSMSYLFMEQRIIWDDKKNRINFLEHGIVLSMAREMFFNGTMQISYDFRKEIRFIGFGYIQDRLYRCCFTIVE